MPLLIAISGHHNSGKTTLGRFLVEELKRRGYRVGVVKSTKEEGLLTDREASDTFLYRKAGATLVVLLQRDLATIYCPMDEENKENFTSWVERFFWDYDLVLLEGFKGLKGLPRIWMLREDEKEEFILQSYPNIDLVVDLNNKDLALEFVLQKLEENEKREVFLFVNGKAISLKAFIRVILKEILFGFLRGLKGLPEKIHHVEVIIKEK